MTHLERKGGYPFDVKIRWFFYRHLVVGFFTSYLLGSGKLIGLNWVVPGRFDYICLSYWLTGVGWACLSSYLRRSFFYGFCLLRGS